MTDISYLRRECERGMMFNCPATSFVRMNRRWQQKAMKLRCGMFWPLVSTTARTPWIYWSSLRVCLLSGRYEYINRHYVIDVLFCLALAPRIARDPQEGMVVREEVIKRLG